MALSVRPFPAGLAARVSSWAGTAGEVLMGCGLAAELADRARSAYPLVFLRVHPANLAAQRCYAGAGFQPVTPAQAAEWNPGQPFTYRWFTWPHDQVDG